MRRGRESGSAILYGETRAVYAGKLTIRPDFEKSWRAVPIGASLGKAEAKRIAEWLQVALPELWKIFENVAVEQAPHKKDGVSNASQRDMRTPATADALQATEKRVGELSKALRFYDAIRSCADGASAVELWEEDGYGNVARAALEYIGKDLPADVMAECAKARPYAARFLKIAGR